MGRRIKSASHARGITIAAFALALLLGTMAVAPYLDAPFIFDDIHTIRDNHHLRNHHSPLYFFSHPESASRMPSTLVRPLLTWTYAIDFHRAGVANIGQTDRYSRLFFVDIVHPVRDQAGPGPDVDGHILAAGGLAGFTGRAIRLGNYPWLAGGQNCPCC